VRSRAVRAPALLPLLGAVLIAAGCGGGTTATSSSPAALRLQREDLIAVSHALRSVEQPIAHEVTATKAAWPLVVNGLHPDNLAATRPPVTAAADSAARVKPPGPLEKSQAASLTGPASQLAAQFSTFNGLTTHGWQQILAAIDSLERGSAEGARFARENVALYIDGVYDGHFSLAQIGKKLQSSYRMLGGQAAFGTALSQAEVDALANTYSEAADRLHPHVGVRLGS
jgi:hypothetical protein